MADGSTGSAVRWRVRGRVQGVGFRAFTRRAAERFGVVGWVANVADGSVEVRAAGTAASLDRLKAEVERGPAFARVDRIESTPLAEPRAWQSFEITASLP